MNKEKVKQEAWNYWHEDLPKDLMPATPNPSFSRGFDLAFEYFRRFPESNKTLCHNCKKETEKIVTSEMCVECNAEC